MFISIIQNEVLLSEGEAYQCTWAATANWTGGKRKNLEIDLMQENRNRDLKKLIKSMGANKTDKSIERASKAVGGVRKCRILMLKQPFMLNQAPMVTNLHLQMSLRS